MNKYLAKMLYALTSAYSRKDYDNLQSGKPVETNIGKLFSIFAWGLDTVHEQADLIKKWDDLDYAEGSVLDRYGANFGVKRGGASDQLYRLFIKVKMIAQLSSGDEDTVIKAAAEFLGVEYTELESEDVYPAKKRIYVDLTKLDEERLQLIEQIGYAIKRTIAAGVGFRLYLRTYRTYRAELKITRGGFLYAADIGTDVGARRTSEKQIDVLHIGQTESWLYGDIPPYKPHRFEKPFDVLHIGQAESWFEGDMPPNTPQTFEKPFDVQHLGMTGSWLDSDMPPYVPQRHEKPFDVRHLGFSERNIQGFYPDASRTDAERMEVARGVNIERHLDTAMPDAERTAELDASVAHGAFQRQDRNTILPDSKRTLRGDSGRSGSMLQTRIKPKRID
ncbi:MAG: hypothetical protein J6I40_06010 [Mailhella sp.]|nr:hypothetical protein [Mailhella sp.]